MDVFSNPILAQIISILVAAACGWLGAQVSRLRRKDEALYCGMKVLLRTTIADAYEAYVTNQTPLSMERKREVDEAYEAYAALGGNSTGKQMYEEICERPIVRL